MSKPSDGAMRAAEVIFKEGYWDVYKTREETFESRWERINNPEKLAHIIDCETGYPELLEALELAHRTLTEWFVQDHVGYVGVESAKKLAANSPVIKELRAAIAKAKGEDR